MTIKKKIIIQKIPLPYNVKNIDYPKNFPRMPRLYLELIENKQKIKQDLINKEYIPPVNLSVETEKPKNIHISHDVSNDKGYNNSDSDSDNVNSNILERYDSKRYDSKRDDDIKSVSNSDVSNDKGYNNSDSDTDSDSDSDSDILEDRLKTLLEKDDNDIESYKSKSRTSKYSRNRSGHSSIYNRHVPTNAPTLSELQQKGGFVPNKENLRDINNVPQFEQNEEDSKREIMFKFQLLKKSYPNSDIPEFSIHSDYNTMKKAYESSVRRLSLDSSVESYKTYLIGGFMVCEFALGNWLGFDMQGFTQQQILSMNSYERLLIELGEKSYVPSGSKWPVEIRLVFLIMMNAAFFIVSKMIMKKTGANLMGMINGMNTKNTQQNNSVNKQPSQPKRKMRGPSVNLNDL